MIAPRLSSHVDGRSIVPVGSALGRPALMRPITFTSAAATLSGVGAATMMFGESACMRSAVLTEKLLVTTNFPEAAISRGG